MKRPRTEDLTDLSPGVTNRETFDKKHQNGLLEVKPAPPMKDPIKHVVVVGAGPGGLMLA